MLLQSKTLLSYSGQRVRWNNLDKETLKNPTGKCIDMLSYIKMLVILIVWRDEDKTGNPKSDYK